MAQRDQSLLDRLRGAGTSKSGSGVFDRHIAYESVRRNILRICRARRGMAEAQRDYGLPEVDYSHGSEASVEQLRHILADNIRNYEPRLADVSVLPAEIGDSLLPAVLIEGRHIADPDGQYAAFIVVCETPNRITVSLA